MDKLLLSLADVEYLIGRKKSWIYREIAAGNFPKPVPVGKTKSWRRDHIEEWCKGLQ